MSSENGDQALLESSTAGETQQKNLKAIYSREFLLSLGELDVCKKLPSGFDKSLLSGLEDTSNNVFERQRSLGSGSCLRGNLSRWDARSSGSSDREADSEKDLPDPGRRFGNQPRRFWQQTEHDGLLGSGAFPRPSGCTGASAPRPRGSGQYQLNRSSESYQPPRSYKAVPYARKDAVDAVNDETFGSSEGTSEDQVEEERKRRESFELMRKEQQKALQDKLKQKTEKQKEYADDDIAALLEKSGERKSTNDERTGTLIAPSLGQNDSCRLPSNVHASVSRPAVPPGFASTVLEKSPSLHTANNSVGAGHLAIEDKVSLSNDVDKTIESTIGLSTCQSSVGLGNMPYKSPSLPEGNKIWEDIVAHSPRKKEPTAVALDAANANHSSSILDELFSNAMMKNSSTISSIEHPSVKDEDVFNIAASSSSKFAHWFLEHDKKPQEDLSYGNLLSLFACNEEVGLQNTLSSDGKTVEVKLPTLQYGKDEGLQKLLSSPAGLAGGTYNHSTKQDLGSSVLTCEDLEQLILAEVKDGCLSSHSISEHLTESDSNKLEEQKVGVDNNASQHLLALLLKGTNSKDQLSLKADAAAFDKLMFIDPNNHYPDTICDVIKSSDTAQNSDNTSTLAALFGAGFMNDLQSGNTPVSAQRGPTSRTHQLNHQYHAIPLLHSDGHFVHSTSQSNISLDGNNSDIFSQTEEENAKAKAKSSLWQGYQQSSFDGLKLMERRYEGSQLEVQLPEEESLITLGGSLDPLFADHLPRRNAHQIENNLSDKTVDEMDIPLFGIREGQHVNRTGLHGPPTLEGNQDLVDFLPEKVVLPIEGQHMGKHRLPGSASLRAPDDHGQSADLLHQLQARIPPQLPQQIHHLHPPLPLMDHHTNRNPHVGFMGPEGIIHHEAHHPLPPNIIPRPPFPNAGGPPYGPSPHHPQMMHENFPSHQTLQNLPRDIPLSHHASHLPGYAPNANNLHGFPINHPQENYGSLGIGVPGPIIGSGENSHPEVLQRLIEMELRANQKQVHPTASSNIPGFYGPELDMGFRYR